MKKTMLFSLIVMACLLGACSSTSQYKDPRLNISQNIERYIQVTNLRCYKNDAGYAVASADVVNNHGREIFIEWKVAWLDENGSEIESIVSTWQKQAIAAGDIKGLKNVSNSKDAVTMRIYIRKLTR